MSVASDGGKVSAHPPVLRDVSVLGHPSSTLYDTGSSICLVSEDFFRLCGAKLSDEHSNISILGVTGSPIDIIGETTLRLDILGQTIEHRFFVSAKKLSFGCDIILGIDFIIGHQLMYNPSNRSVHFLKPVSTISSCLRQSSRLSPRRRKRVRFLLSTTDENVPSEDEITKLFTSQENEALTIDDEKSYPLFVKDTVKIPHYSEQFVRMKLPRNLKSNDFPYLVQGHFDQSIKGIQVARAITFLTKSTTLVRVANVSDQPVILRRNLRISQVHPTRPPSTRLGPESRQSGAPDTPLTARQTCLGQHSPQIAHRSRASSLGQDPQRQTLFGCQVTTKTARHASHTKNRMCIFRVFQDRAILTRPLPTWHTSRNHSVLSSENC